MDQKKLESAAEETSLTMHQASLLNFLARVPLELRGKEWALIESKFEPNSFASEVAAILLGRHIQPSRLAQDYALMLLSSCGPEDEAKRFVLQEVEHEQRGW